MMHKSKFIGSTLIIAGTALGAGMFALPLVSASSGFGLATILLVLIWALMVCTGLLILEVNLAFPIYRNNFSSMAAATVGRCGKFITWIAMMALLYSLAAAYIAGGSSVLSASINGLFSGHTPTWIYAVIFTFILGGAVFWSAQATDILNRGLLSVKGFLLVATLALLMPHISAAKLAEAPGSLKFIWAAAPIYLCAFGFHHIIPSLTNYMGKKPRALKWVIITGATAPLIIYFFWLLTTLGIAPKHQLHGSVGELIKILSAVTKDHWVTAAIEGFSNIAMTTSFLGVTLGLFDFLADAFNRPNSRGGRLQTALITFIPPLFFAIYYPQGFVIALGFAAIFVAVLEIVLPALMAYKLRRNSNLSSPMRVRGGTPLLVIIFFAGIALIAIQIASSLHILVS